VAARNGRHGRFAVLQTQAGLKKAKYEPDGEQDPGCAHKRPDTPVGPSGNVGPKRYRGHQPGDSLGTVPEGDPGAEAGEHPARTGSPGSDLPATACEQRTSLLPL
jgi:hypothetical protein